MPIRLWSTVVNQLAKRPSYHAGVRTGSALAATRASCVVLLEVRDERGDLVVRPALADGRHPTAALRHELGEPLRVDEQRVAADVRADQLRALRREAVALAA